MPSVLKYVVLRGHADDFPALLFCTAPTTHRELARALAATHAPVSAGFCAPLPLGGWRVFGASDSLCLAPTDDDAQLIDVFTRSTARLALAAVGRAVKC